MGPAGSPTCSPPAAPWRTPWRRAPAPRRPRSPPGRRAGQAADRQDRHRDALRAFAAEIDDPAGDRIAAALIIATSRRGGGAHAVLSALAEMLGRDVAARREIDAERAQHRTTVRWIIVFIVGFTVFAAAEPRLLGAVRHGAGPDRARAGGRAVRGRAGLAAPARQHPGARAGSSTRRRAAAPGLPGAATGRARSRRPGLARGGAGEHLDRAGRPRGRPRRLRRGPRDPAGTRPAGCGAGQAGRGRAGELPPSGPAGAAGRPAARRGRAPGCRCRARTWRCSARTARPGSPARSSAARSASPWCRSSPRW